MPDVVLHPLLYLGLPRFGFNHVPWAQENIWKLIRSPPRTLMWTGPPILEL